MIDAARWCEVLVHCGVRPQVAAEWAPIFERRVQRSAFNLGDREIDDFVGQVLHETARLEQLEENLNYRPERLCQVWPHRFPGVAAAMPYAYNPEALAEMVYGRRPDLGNTQPGDGYKYRARGIPGVTGKANYLLLQKLTLLPLVDNPDLLKRPDTAMQCGLLWWERRIPDSAIDSIERTTRAVNGGTVGLEDRRWLTVKAGEKLAVVA